MNRRVMAGLVAGTALLPFASAEAAPDPGPGRRCAFSSASDPGGEPDTHTGIVDGGPLLLGDDTDPTVTYRGSLTCTIQVGPNATHAGLDAVAVTGPTTPTFAVLPETTMSYLAAQDDNVYLCTQVNIEGGDTLYWAVDNAAVPPAGTWSTDPSSECGLAISASAPGEDEFPFDVVDPLVQPFLDALAAACGGGDPGQPTIQWLQTMLANCVPPPPPPSPPAGHLTIHRFPVDGARLWVPPAGWSCTDIHTGLPVGFHSPLQTPDPGVSCLPNGTDTRCNRLQVGGYHADAGLGAITITSSCSTFSASATTTIPFGWGAGFTTGVNGSGTTPWTCQVTEALQPVNPDYWVFCDVNI